MQTLHARDAMGWSAIGGESTTHFQARALCLVTTVALAGVALREVCNADPTLGYAITRRRVELAAECLDAMRWQAVSDASASAAELFRICGR